MLKTKIIKIDWQTVLKLVRINLFKSCIPRALNIFHSFEETSVVLAIILKKILKDKVQSMESIRVLQQNQF